MQFLIENDDLLEKYNTIWDKMSADINFSEKPKIFENQNKTSW